MDGTLHHLWGKTWSQGGCSNSYVCVNTSGQWLYDGWFLPSAMMSNVGKARKDTARYEWAEVAEPIGTRTLPEWYARFEEKDQDALWWEMMITAIELEGTQCSSLSSGGSTVSSSCGGSTVSWRYLPTLQWTVFRSTSKPSDYLNLFWAQDCEPAYGPGLAGDGWWPLLQWTDAATIWHKAMRSYGIVDDESWKVWQYMWEHVYSRQYTESQCPILNQRYGPQGRERHSRGEARDAPMQERRFKNGKGGMAGAAIILGDGQRLNP